jgi:hypothetical protein
MYLAWIEIRRSAADVVELVQKEFSDFAPARSWAAGELDTNAQTTGNAAVFETQGPLVRLAWETHADDQPVPSSHHIRRLYQPQNRPNRQNLALRCPQRAA